MKKIGISESLKSEIPNLKLGLISAEVIYEKLNTDLWEVIDKEIERIKTIPIEMIKEIHQIHSSRDAYKSLGKEPARYRLSAEALHRRIINGKGIYQINNIVDVINLASVKTGYSIGGYDSNKIKGNVLFDIGKANEEYEAIGRGKLNIDSLPVFRDETGAFGSPTSDSLRTMISEKTKNILLIVVNFGGHENFHKDLLLITQLLKEYCNAIDIKIEILQV